MNEHKLSKHLVMVKSNSGDTYAYNSILGGLKKLTKDELHIIEKITGNKSLNENEKGIAEGLKNYNFIQNIDDEYKLIEPILKQYKKGKRNEKITCCVYGFDADCCNGGRCTKRR